MIAANLDRALARHLGDVGEVRNLVRVTGGATKSTWIFEVAVRGEPQRLVMQLTSAAEGQDRYVATKLNARDDARLMRLVQAHGVPAPQVVAQFDEIDALGQGHLTRWIEGETLAPKLLREERYAQARQVLPTHCAHALAQIHQIPVATAQFLPTLDAAAQWERYRAIVDLYKVNMPALEWGLRWLKEHLPPPVPLAVVHGDFRLGNLIVNQQGLACVLDWELAALGDPMQDLGWLCLKTWRFGGKFPVAGIGEREEFYRAYESARGLSVDVSRVRFWEAFGHVKWAIMCLSMGLGKGDAPVSLEHRVIGRRVEEPLWDLLQLLEGKD